MPIYEIEAPDGRILEIEGDQFPSEAELNDIFASTQQVQGQGTESQPFQVGVSKNVDLRPSGVIDKVSDYVVGAPVAAVESLVTKKPFKETFGKQVERFNQIEELPTIKPVIKRGNALTDMSSAFLLPEVKAFQGAGALATLGNRALTGAYQGGLIGGVESLANEGDLSGVIPGASWGAGLNVGLPFAGNIAEKSVKVAPMVGGFLGRALGRIQPETLKQAVKPNSIALDLDRTGAENLLMNTTERVRKGYQNLLNKAGDKVKEEVAKLRGIESRIALDDIDNEVRGLFNAYQGDNINPARNLTGRLEQDLYNTINSGAEGISDVSRYLLDQKPSVYNLEKEKEAFEILSEATGKSVKWLKSQLNALNKGKATTKRGEFIENLLDKTDDKLDLQKMGNRNDYKYYHNANLGYDNAGAEAGYNLARQAYDDIVNRNFTNQAQDPLTRAIDNAEYDYGRILQDVVDNARNSNVYGTAMTKLESAIKNLPIEIQETYATRLAQDLDDIYIKTNSMSPMDLQKLKEQVGKMINWSDETARGYKNPILEQLYGKLDRKLSALSPELEKTNKFYSQLSDFKKNEGVNTILRPGNSIDTASSKLRNYNSTVTSGNKNRNIQDLENILVANGQKPFLNDIDDINAAMDLLNARTTGDSWLANIATQATRPALKLARYANRKGLPQAYANLKRALPQNYIPYIYSIQRMFGQEQ